MHESVCLKISRQTLFVSFRFRLSTTTATTTATTVLPHICGLFHQTTLFVLEPKSNKNIVIEYQFLTTTAGGIVDCLHQTTKFLLETNCYQEYKLLKIKLFLKYVLNQQHSTIFKRGENFFSMFSKSVIILTALQACLLTTEVVAIQNKVCYTFVGPCPTSWHHWGTSCYRVTEASFPWASARDECRKSGGILAVPGSTQENDFIVTLVPDSVWIDCNDIEKDGVWDCNENGTVVSYRNWDEKEGVNQREDCAAISRRFGSFRKWHDYTCSDDYPAVCKLRATSPHLKKD